MAHVKTAANALALALALAACSSSSSSKPATPPAPAPMDPGADVPRSCSSGDDCALVQACCGCNAGGKQIAIRADAVASFDASREQRCAGQMCAQMISTDPSCDAESTCGTNNLCNVTPHLQHE